MSDESKQRWPHRHPWILAVIALLLGIGVGSSGSTTVEKATTDSVPEVRATSSSQLEDRIDNLYSQVSELRNENRLLEEEASELRVQRGERAKSRERQLLLLPTTCQA